MRVVGLDISTHTGWAVWDSDSGVKVSKGVQSYPAENSRFSRWVKYADYFYASIQALRPCKVFIEGYGYNNAHTLVTLVEVGTAIRLQLQQSSVEWREVPPTVLKKFLTGSGAARKELVLLDVYRKYGVECRDSNEADAVALAYFGAAVCGYGPKLTKVQQDVIKRYIGGK